MLDRQFNQNYRLKGASGTMEHNEHATSQPVTFNLSLALAALPTLGVALLMGLSVMYDYAFLQTLGLGLSEVQTTLADHLRSAVVWSPVVAVVLVLLLIYEYISRSAFRKWLAVYKRGSPAVRKLKKLALVIGLLPGIVFLTISGATTALAFIVLTVATASFVMLLGGREVISNQQRTLLAAALVFSLSFLVVLRGAVSAERMLRASPARWEVQLKEQDRLVHAKARGMRAMGSMLVMVFDDRTVALVPAERLVSAVLTQRFDEPSAPRHLACTLLSVLCDLRIDR